MAVAQPVAFRLIATLVSTTARRRESGTEFECLLGLRIVASETIEEFSHLNSIETEQTRKLPFAEQFTLPGFRGKQVEP